MSRVRFPARIWDSLNASSTVALVLTGALLGVTHGTARVAWVITAAGMAGLQVFAQARRRSVAKQATATAEQLADDIRTSTNYAISNAFTPILRLVTELFEAPDEASRALIRGQIEVSVLYAASSAIGPDVGVRACFFVLEQDAGGPLRLQWSGQLAGRADEPKSRFERGTPSGDAALTMVVDDHYLFVRDMAEPPPGWDGHDHLYRTFLAVPVRAADHASGMLTVDSLAPGDLEPDRDKPVLTVLARILAISQIASAEPVGRGDADDPPGIHAKLA